MDYSAYKINTTISTEGKLVNYLNEDGELQTIASIKHEQKSTYEINGISSSSSLTTYLYADGSNFYKRDVSTDNITGASSEARIHITKNEFISKVTEFAGMVGESRYVPTEESAFITFVGELFDSKGYKFAIDDSKDLKIKMFVKDKDKYVESPSMELNTMEMYCIFDKDGWMTATKMIMDMTMS
jgi:hypothetical protein